MNEFTWRTTPTEVSTSLMERPLLARLMNLSYAAAVLESLGTAASHIAGGVWGMVNPVLDEMSQNYNEEDILCLARDLLLMSHSNNPKEEWVRSWEKTNGWELLFRVKDTRQLADLFNNNPDLFGISKDNIEYEGYSLFLRGEEDVVSPQPYLGFITSCVILKIGAEYKSNRGLFGLVLEKIANDDNFHNSMERICAWPDAARPAEVMKRYLDMRPGGVWM